jgi:DNA mismatch endonuclease (patch repair protein)
MSRVKSKDSLAELRLRTALHARGLRYRLHRRIEGITVDLVFPGPKVVVLVDGCFWHGCPKHATYPKTNKEYWLPKLEANRQRDERQSVKLRSAQWKVFRVWEHDCLPPSPRVVNRIVSACTGGRRSKKDKGE